MPATKPAREVDFEVLGKEPPRGFGGAASDDPFIALISRFMDDIFVIPGTNIRFGLDPLVGLLPALGPTATSVVSLFLIAMSARRGVPKIVLTRMAANVLLNAALGSVPIIGDFGSIFFRSNTRNYELLRKHAGAVRASTRGDWVFVGALFAVVLLVIGLMIAGSLALLRLMLPGLF